MMMMMSVRVIIVVAIGLWYFANSAGALVQFHHDDLISKKMVLYDTKLANRPSYSDDWLFNFHNKAQDEKQLITDSLALWNEEQQHDNTDIFEWQESFQRNGLADFTPPATTGLNCLMVGVNLKNHHSNDHQQNLRFYGNNKLPWEVESEARITFLGISSASNNQKLATNSETQSGSLTKNIPADNLSQHTSLISKGFKIPPEPTASTKIRASRKEVAFYDCIVDQGLMSAVLNDQTTVEELLCEAAVALREHGIYVLVTHTLTDGDKHLLQSLSVQAGLEWQFELDGISDEISQVSVARRFCTGAMPEVGRLSRYRL